MASAAQLANGINVALLSRNAGGRVIGASRCTGATRRACSTARCLGLRRGSERGQQEAHAALQGRLRQASTHGFRGREAPHEVRRRTWGRLRLVGQACASRLSLLRFDELKRPDHRRERSDRPARCRRRLARHLHLYPKGSLYTPSIEERIEAAAARLGAEAATRLLARPRDSPGGRIRPGERPWSELSALAHAAAVSASRRATSTGGLRERLSRPTRRRRSARRSKSGCRDDHPDYPGHLATICSAVPPTARVPVACGEGRLPTAPTPPSLEPVRTMGGVPRGSFARRTDRSERGSGGARAPVRAGFAAGEVEAGRKSLSRRGAWRARRTAARRRLGATCSQGTFAWT